MHEAYFEYNGKRSTDFHLRIENNIIFPSPERDVSFISVLGKDGELAVDNDRLKSVRFPLPIRLQLPQHVTVNEAATNVSNWLKSNAGWHRLYFSGQPNYYYEALINEQFDIAETLRQRGKTVIVFRLRPIKFFTDAALRPISNNTTIVNSTPRIAKPYIKVTGSGDITLFNNGAEWLKLNTVDQFIEVDSELMAAYKGTEPQGLKMSSELRPMFPLLNVGSNAITWTGNVTSVEIETRLGLVL